MLLIKNLQWSAVFLSKAVTCFSKSLMLVALSKLVHAWTPGQYCSGKMHKWHRQAHLSRNLYHGHWIQQLLTTHLMCKRLACGGTRLAETSEGTTAAFGLIRGGCRAGGPIAPVGLNQRARSCQACWEAWRYHAVIIPKGPMLLDLGQAGFKSPGCLAGYSYSPSYSTL